MSEVIHYLVVAGIFWAVFCRARVMDAETRRRVKLQYGSLLIGSMLSLPIWRLQDFAPALLGGAVLLYLWLDARRWRHGVPR